MSFSFSFGAPSDISAAVRKVKQLIESNGGTFSGTEESGTFVGKTPVGKVTGQYAIAGGKVTIEITGKPWVLTEGKVKGEIMEYFSA